MFGGKLDLVSLLDTQEKTLEQLSQEFTNKYRHIKYFAGSNRTTKEDEEYLSAFYTQTRLCTGAQSIFLLYMIELVREMLLQQELLQVLSKNGQLIKQSNL